jgi:hypothetical protein
MNAKSSEPELCANCGEVAGPADYAQRPWGRVEEAGPGGVLVTRYLHSRCYLQRNRARAALGGSSATGPARQN